MLITLNANGIELDGFTATNAGSYPYVGIKVISSYNTLIGNIASNNLNMGIQLDSSSNNMLIGNTASNNLNMGIHLYLSSNNTLSGNTASNNNNPGIGLLFSSNNTFSGNTASNNLNTGIYLYSSSNNTFSGNTASNQYYGIVLLPSSNNNTIIGNTASDNDYYSIWLNSSSSNILHHNNLVGNTNYNAYDYNGSNQWDSGAEGNYYGDGYTGTDSDGDGIGDTPHPIPGGSSEDRYPLMQQWSDTPLKGDLNGDDQITPADAAIALQLAATGAHDDAADVSGDGRVTSLDALMILQAAAGTREYPIAGCGDLDQNILRMYDEDGDGWIDEQWAINAGIDLEYHRITQSGYDQVKYAYEHKCPVEPAE